MRVDVLKKYILVVDAARLLFQFLKKLISMKLLVIINHDFEVGDYVHIARGVIISRGVKIGSNSLIGAGITII